ncbi:amidohydrolase [Secundilactobacillus paracollinoides]|uniref:Iron permease n=1 Tax=Secundilactobacillus paracollinoides TaxID=240427 RepID=A0A1B2IY58_9LACO|nr:amidohydrolase [Secundilactobacillus paracollinoides]ANZ61037.1 iron permease [Secundilactobacillus paracollinoides]ANZ66959.1 iron permease [Secundilactobacillus paracollinoides]
MTMLSKEELEKRLVFYRHYFHEHPELADHEFNTTKTITKILTDWEITILPTQLATGVFAEIGHSDGPTIALRADIDALPIQEKSGVAFSSKNAGVMHACGHDTHMASLLGAAYLLKQQERDLKGRVKLIFQLSEEDNEGALQVINDGQIDDVDAILGFHNTPNYPVDHIGIRAGITNGAIDKFKVTLHGVGTHASTPDKGQDPIVALGAEINALQSIASRNLDAFQAGVLSITHVSAGNTWNILPDTAFFEGTVRTASKQLRQLIKTRFLDIVNYTAKAYQVAADIDWYDGDPSVNNDAKLTAIVRDESSKFATVYEQEQRLGSDDFSCYQERIPGVYANIGNGETISAHNPYFKADDALIRVGVKYFERNALRLLDEL